MYFCSGPPRFEGDRPRFGDRDGYRAGPRGPPGEFGGEKGGAPADYQPAFRVSQFVSFTLLIQIFRACFVLRNEGNDIAIVFCLV